MTSRLAATLLAVATAATVSACGAGLSAQTYQQRDQAETTDTSVGDLELRNVGITAPDTSEGYAVGDDATVIITVTNAGTQEDRLAEVTSSAAQEVVVLAGGAPRTMVIPPQGSTGSFVTLELRGLTRALRPGEYVDLSLRFEDNGTVELLAPVATTGEADRPIYTGERLEGGEEPALQAPAGGHSEGGAEGEGEGEEGGEPGPVVGEAETGEEPTG